MKPSPWNTLLGLKFNFLYSFAAERKKTNKIIAVNLRIENINF